MIKRHMKHMKVYCAGSFYSSCFFSN